MNYGRILTDSWQLVWRHRFLWLLGLAVGLGSILFTALRLAYAAQIIQVMRDPAAFLTAAEPEQWLTWLLGSTVVIFVISIGYWLLATVAQGAIIGAALELDAGRPSSLRSAWRVGVGLLGRFVAIDTLVFFPWFVLSLALLLLLSGGMVGLSYWVMQGGDVGTVALLTSVGGVCSLPLLLLLLPVGMATAVFRTLAFRETAVQGTAVRLSIRHTWRLIRRQWGTVLIFWLLLWGVQSGVGLLLSMVTGLIMGLTAVFPISAHWLGWLLGAVTAVPLALLHATIAVAWTMAYKSSKVAE